MLHIATGYCDGSLVLGKWAPFRSTGFGIAVLSSDGELIGFGNGTPPSRISRAAAAELWAIAIIIEMNPFPPHDEHGLPVHHLGG